MARPPRYRTPEKMQIVIDHYFNECEGTYAVDSNGELLHDKNGKPYKIGERPPTITGLALALGFTSRQALLNYQEKERFIDTVTRAKARCEEYAERRLYDRDGARGAEFSLRCNFKWRTETDEAGKETNDLMRSLIGALNNDGD